MINASIVSSLLSEKFSQSEASIKVNLRAPSIREQEIANHLAELLNSIINSHTFTVESESTLVYISNELSEDDVDQYVASDDSELDPDFNDTGDDEARQSYLPVHDLGLRRWDLEKAKQELLHDFVASEKWLFNFKIQHNICSRKVTKVVTTKQVTNQEEVQHSADEFVSRVRDLLPKYDPDYVINTDQSGIQLEFHSTRTLSYKGETTTALTVRSKNAITHSFTVQPCVSLSGKLVGPLFLCLKESTSYLSENVRDRLFKASNIVVSCSTSGKLTTVLVKFWRDNVLLPSISSHRTLLIFDCWSGQGNTTGIYDNIKNLHRLEIPKHTTAQIQPLDLFYNNQHKYIARRMFDRVLLDGLDINLSERNCIIRSQSLIYN
ncbi:unnamed protein product [Rotaria sp. Silwood1]|nr:unnamed protein product [Rotaria sp. Silwood1]